MSDRQIQEAVQRLAGVQLADQVYLVEGTVTAVDVSTRTCTVLVGSDQSEYELPGVRLMAEVDDGVLIIPSVDSPIIVGYSKRILPFVCQFSQVERVLTVTGGTSIEVKDGLIQLNDGSYGGLVQVTALVKKMNALEDLLNDLITKYNTHIHPASSGTTSPTASQETRTITARTKQADLENTSVKHGK
jgi:hypothetical protein